MPLFINGSVLNCHAQIRTCRPRLQDNGITSPKHADNDGTEIKQGQSQQAQPEVKAEPTVNTVNVHTTDTPQGHNPSMVAEP